MGQAAGKAPGMTAEMADEAEGGAATLSEQAYRLMRRDIVDGLLAPNQPLRFEFLKDRYGFSFSPLREALAQLQSERLVVATAQRGYRVADVSLDEMWDAINTRVLIETQALREAIVHGDDDWEGAVVSAYHALSRSRARHAGTATDEAAMEEVERRHRVFHRSLIGACRSRWLLDLSALLYTQTERYRRPLLAKMRADISRDREIDDHHKEIMDATLIRDAATATDLLAAHLRRTGNYIERIQG